MVNLADCIQFLARVGGRLEFFREGAATLIVVSARGRKFEQILSDRVVNSAEIDMTSTLVIEMCQVLEESVGG